MVFSSITFIYYFLPIMLILYIFASKKYKNIVLLISSLIFYFYGEVRYFLLFIFSIIFNYFISKLIEKNKDKKRKFYLIIGLTINFLVLFYFKYYNFFIENINLLFKTNISLLNILIPLGISFFTFKNASYLIDVYKKKTKSAKNIIYYATYLSMFCTLVQGPIIRYNDIQNEIEKRNISFKMFSKGISRFVIGLSKKVLLADVLGKFIQSLTLIENQTIISAWLKAISDILRLYLDFSGYSDMAIGLGLMLGFHFLENFDYPFWTNSLTKFWRKWHISLTNWFKDYIYIPLGGNKVNNIRKYLNILIVWLLTGLWHKASYCFLLWGLYFGIILIIEKKFLLNFFDKHKIIGLLWTNIVVVIGFVMFYNDSLTGLLLAFKNMFGFNNISFINTQTLYYFVNYLFVLIISIIASTPLLKNVINKLKENKKINKAINFLEPIFYIILLILCTAFIISDSTNPFLYFRF